MKTNSVREGLSLILKVFNDLKNQGYRPNLILLVKCPLGSVEPFYSGNDPEYLQKKHFDFFCQLQAGFVSACIIDERAQIPESLFSCIIRLGDENNYVNNDCSIDNSNNSLEQINLLIQKHKHFLNEKIMIEQVFKNGFGSIPHPIWLSDKFESFGKEGGIRHE